MLCLTPIRRQPDGIPTLGRAANKTGGSCQPDAFYFTPSDGRGFAAWLHLRVLARGCPHLVMVNAGFDRNGLKFLDQLHKALHGHFKHAPAKLWRGRGCVAAYTVA